MIYHRFHSKIARNNAPQEWGVVGNGLGELREDGTPGLGSNALVLAAPGKRQIYDPEYATDDWHRTPPILGLFHELVHAEEYVYGRAPRGEMFEHGNPVDNTERSAVGLPWDQNGDGVEDQ